MTAMPAPEISVCVCTCFRPRGLARLLESLRALDPATPSREIIVVDNDGEGSAAPVADAALASGMALRYLVEPVRNIARARNACVAVARGRYLAFVDDDEVVSPRWLLELHRAVLAHSADGGVGRVEPVFDPAAPAWITVGGFFDHHLPPAGTPLLWYQTRTSNALVRSQALAELTGPFDEAFGLTGGEDVDLFARLIESGGRIVAAPAARVRETLPLARTAPGWLIRRHFRNGTTTACVQRRGLSGMALAAYAGEALWKTGTHGVKGVALLPWSRPRGLARILRCADSLGRLVSIFGMRYFEYAAIPRE